MIRLLAALIAVMAAPTQAAEPNATVTVERDSSGWTANYAFGESAPVWVFADSIEAREEPKLWRQHSWKVMTPGVRLERKGWYDVLVAESGPVPKKVTIRFEPFVRDIEAAYDAALAFTDGSVALYGGKFEVFPAGSVAAVEKLPIDLGSVDGIAASTRVTMSDRSGPVLFGSKRVAEARLDQPSAYVLFGKLEPVESDSLATVVDPQLPLWLADFMTSAIPAVLDKFTQSMGPPPGDKPLLLASWAGPTAGLNSMGGSVLASTIVMAFEGERLANPNAKAADNALWFAAHESAHFWLGQAVAYERPQDAWITEGGADLLAYRAVAATNPKFDSRAELQSALDSCLEFSAKGGVSGANERGDHKAYYHCGAIFALIAERSSDGDFPGFVSALIQSNRDDRKVSRAEWLALLDKRAEGRGLSQRIGLLLDRPGNAGDWAGLLELGGIAHRVEGDGSIKLQ